eukprot:5830020-Alexandrium_andersonii.AAC.1
MRAGPKGLTRAAALPSCVPAWRRRAACVARAADAVCYRSAREGPAVLSPPPQVQPGIGCAQRG